MRRRRLFPPFAPDLVARRRRAGTALGAALFLAACGGEDTPEDANANADADRSDDAAASERPLSEAADELIASVGDDEHERFKRWTPIHASMHSPVIAGTPVSSKEAIVLTKDNHVGVTTDAGDSWQFHRVRNGRVYAIDGFAGGPFVAVGADGFVIRSEDGVIWNDLPRHTSEDLVDVVASELGVLAIGNRGAFVRYDKDGVAADDGALPDGFKAKAILEQSGAVVAFAGKKAYGTVDGTTWTRFESDLDLPSAKVSLTSAGACAMGKVAGNKGVVCSVTGTAYGISDALKAVERNGIVALTRNDGRAWKTASLPFSGVNVIFGKDGGSIFAAGKGGRIAVTKNDGKSWIDLEWEETADLNDALVDGEKIIIVGDRQTLVYSTNGGKTWNYAEPEFGGNFDHVAKVNGKYVVTDGKVAISSTGLDVWDEELTDLPEIPASPEACTELPEPREACRFASGLTTPEGMPDVKAFRFSGDVGIAYGDDGLTAFSGDGGASWKAKVGLGLGPLSLLEVRDDIILVSDGSQVAMSSDGGQRFTRAQLPAKVRINALLITESGVAFAGGPGGTLLRSVGDGEAWKALETVPNDKTSYVALFEVGSTLFAAGSKGELWRSVDGDEWLPVPMGGAASIQAMTGEGDTTLAVTRSSRNTSNVLLRSDDGGAHFFTVTELSHTGAATDFRLEDGVLRYRDRISDDLGLSWRRAVDRYWAGAVPIEDGSGKSIVAYGDRYGKDRLYVVGEDEDDWRLFDGAFAENAQVRCSVGAGCWMIADGALYRPVDTAG